MSSIVLSEFIPRKSHDAKGRINEKLKRLVDGKVKYYIDGKC